MYIGSTLNDLNVTYLWDYKIGSMALKSPITKYSYFKAFLSLSPL